MEYHHWLPPLFHLHSAMLVCLMLMFWYTNVINIDIVHKLQFLTTSGHFN